MGCCTSKQARAAQRRKSTSPVDKEKHTSASSSTPLAASTATFRSRTNTLETEAITVASSRDPQSFSNNQAVRIDDTEGHSNVSRPPPPPRLRRLSELIDPEDINPNARVRSPSGNLLAAEEFLKHPDRPPSMRERQEIIRERVRAASRLGAVAVVGGAEEELEKARAAVRLKKVCFLSRI